MSARLFTSWTTLALVAGAQVVVVPTDIQMPGTQPLQVSGLQSPTKCDNCHGGYDPPVEPAYNWRGSMMAHATRDPIFWATVAVAEQDFAGAGDLCLRCHTPDGWLGGRSTPTDGSGLLAGDADGVSCDLCHRATNPDLSEWLGVQTEPFVANDGADPPTGYYGSGMYSVWAGTNTKFGPYATTAATHDFVQSEFHRSAAFCGTCHDVSNPAVGDLAPGHGAQVPLADGTYNGALGGDVTTKAAFNNFPYQYGVVERTFSEHQASAFATLPVSDYPGLPPELQAGALQAAYDAAIAASPDANYVDGAVRLFTCQSCHMPPVTGKGCNKAGAPLRTDLPLHDMTGGNTWVPDVIAYLDGLGKLVVGGGLSALELAALDDGQERARQTLTRAAALNVDGDELTVVNLTGHKLISGYPEGRRMWLDVKWYDGAGMLVREDGAYGDLLVTLDGQPTVVRTLLDLDGANTRLYEAHYGMSQAWADKLVTNGYAPAGLVLEYDRVTGEPGTTLGELSAMPPGSVVETFHFVLNDTIASDTRIPPYGMRYDDAVARNLVPVPAAQYGTPGPGEVYEHRDVVALDPPPGAVTATIDLLYQSTSWEYVQFLHLANTGAVATLASTGADLLDAWLATGMAEPEIMASTTWTAAGGVDPWTDLGGALAGTYGEPDLAGDGTLVGGTPVTFTVANALEASPLVLFIGLSQLDAPFKGGTLVPNPDILISGLVTNAAGGLVLPAIWPGGVPSNVTVFYQAWIVDPAGPKGLSATNGLAGTTP